MPNGRNLIVVAVRWMFVIVLLMVLAVAIWASEDAIDRLTRSICPEGWWHTSEFWAHCAYTRISITKYGAMYAGYAILALLVIYWVAPVFKQGASRILLLALMAQPVYHLLLVRFSWVEVTKLAMVVLVALVFAVVTWRNERVRVACGEKA
jgi:hypothetical protein